MELATGTRPATRPWLSATTFQRTDLRNIGLLLLGFTCMVMLVSPVRAYPVNDDWAYAKGVLDLLHWDYKLPGAQATSLGHIAWGAIFCTIFGFSFTALSAATLIMSAVCLGLFYFLLRYLQIRPGYALMGSAMLGLNPIYVSLSYSFMTDVTFLALLLGSVLCYLRGMEKENSSLAYLWVGSIIAAWAYLTRQFGILLVPSALFYLWWSRNLTWRAVLSITVIPLTTIIIYMLWERAQPVPLVELYLEQVMKDALSDPLAYLVERLQRLDWVLSAPGLILLPLVWKPRRILLAIPIFLPLIILQLRSAKLYGTLFPQFGNVVDHTGFIMGFYTAQPIWTQLVWTVLGIIGSASIALFVAACSEQLWAWLRTHPWREKAKDPTVFIYVLGFLTLVVVMLLPLFPFDRHFLPVIIVIMVAYLRRMSKPEERPVDRSRIHRSVLSILPLRIAMIAFLGLFALLAQRDYNAHADVRWKAAESLAATGVPRDRIDGGFEWAGWYLYDEGEHHIKETGDYSRLYFAAYAALDPEYVISDVPRDGYIEVRSLPYSSWLSGGETRSVLVLKRKKA